jgi:hypothetical protein
MIGLPSPATEPIVVLTNETLEPDAARLGVTPQYAFF